MPRLAPLRTLTLTSVAIFGFIAPGPSSHAEGDSGKGVAPPPPPFLLEWRGSATGAASARVEVRGLDEATLARLRDVDWSRNRWQELLSVEVAEGDPLADLDRPPMIGDHSISGRTLVFVPRFPLEPGLQYRAVFRPAQLPGGSRQPALARIFEIPARQDPPSTTVSVVHPTAEVVPENLLKFYLHFSAPMSRGHIHEYLELREAEGQPVRAAFLELDEELWDPTMTRLTLLIDPGRIKRGVRPLEEIGPALEDGRRYRLLIRRSWLDATGRPLVADYEKSFRVGPPDREPPDPTRWGLTLPAAGSGDALAINFQEPLDYALAHRMIRVKTQAGEGVDGEVELKDFEHRWRFVPRQTWKAGAYQLVIQSTIEDLAGNNIGKAFEVDLFEEGQRRLTDIFVQRSFEIR